MRKLLEGLRHLFTPMHTACRLVDCGLSMGRTRRVCAVWEWVYRRPRVVLVAVVTALILFSCQAARAGHDQPEKYYQRLWCASAGGALETTPRPGLRVDCETTTHAVEFDFANKWAEAVGQSLAYAGATGKRAGIVLILEREGDERFLEKLRFTIVTSELPIDVWPMGAGVEVGDGR